VYEELIFSINPPRTKEIVFNLVLILSKNKKTALPLVAISVLTAVVFD
jgi:hypothetical protein